MNYVINTLKQVKHHGRQVILFVACSLSVRFYNKTLHVLSYFFVGYEPTSPRAGNKEKSPDASDTDEKRLRVPGADRTDSTQTSGKPFNHELCHPAIR